MNAPNTNPGAASVRVDLWLWAARFFKTRGLAQRAVTGGHVQVNGQRIKPSRDVQAGDRLEIRRGEERFVVDVAGVARRRGPATEARKLYEETEESRMQRERERERRSIERAAEPRYPGRPDKKGRRALRRLKEQSE